MDRKSDDWLTGQIYDAAFDPDLWVPVMEQIADRLAGQTACMTTLDIFAGTGTGLAALAPDKTMDAYFDTWAHDNPLHEIGDPLPYISNWRPGILRYEEWVEKDALHRSAFFNEFLRPIDAQNGIMMGLALAGTSTVTMNIARSLKRDMFDDAEIAVARRWQSHLSRAVRLGQAVQVSHAALDAVDHLVAATSQCLFFLDRHGRVRRMSGAAETMLEAGAELYLVNGVLTAKGPEEDARLRQLIADAAMRAGEAATGGAMLLRPQSGPPREIHVTPLGPRGFANWSSEPIILVAVTARAAPYLPIEERLRARFGLTPAEARVALALRRGGTLREIADAAAVSIHTVRVQLGMIFSKTNCRRQADLVRMLVTCEQDDM